MNRSDLIERLAQLHPQLPFKDSDLVVKVILDALTTTLLKGGRVEIRNFGSFDLHYKPPRIGRNPKTGCNVPVPAKYVPHFNVGKVLKERVIRSQLNSVCSNGS
jgi:integration host factor subunit beta